MEITTITCQADLVVRKEELKALKSQQEATISMQFDDLKNSLTIGTIIKESVAHIATDKDTRLNLVKIAANTGTSFIIEKVLGSNNSIQRYLGSLIAAKVSKSVIGKMISRFL